jgi:hypothetical protein
MQKERLSAWDKAEMETNVEVNPSSQTIAKPTVGCCTVKLILNCQNKNYESKRNCKCH